MSLRRFHTIRADMDAAYSNGHLVLASDLARDYLELADQYPKDWNYGNAIHHAHILLGKIAIRNNDLVSARTHLLKSGKTPGSPQLDSFGPNMSLALELLKVGEKESVLEFLELVDNFWNKILSTGKLGLWKTMIANDEIPDFGGHLLYKL